MSELRFLKLSELSITEAQCDECSSKGADVKYVFEFEKNLCPACIDELIEEHNEQYEYEHESYLDKIIRRNA
jgi:hypothetical protein